MGGKYMMLDSILEDDEHSSIRHLEPCLSNEALMHVCTCKGSDDMIAYKLDKDRVVAWLSLKIQRLANHLKTSNIKVSAGAQAGTYNKGSTKNEDDCLRYAWMMISDYVTPELSTNVKENLCIKEPVKPVASDENVEPPAKKQKKEAVVEDYRDEKPQIAVAKAKKLTAAQKSLQKVDKKGMKTMASFFSKTPKK